MRAQHQVGLLTVLSLTATQQQQATTIFTNAATAEDGGRNMKTVHRALHDAIEANDAAAIDQAAANIGNLTAQTCPNLLC